MCNYDYEPQEKNENEESRTYRKRRGDLLDAVLNVESTLKDALVKITLYASYNRFKLKEYQKLEIQDIITTLGKCHFEFKEDDTFIMDVPFALYEKHKMRIETTFNDGDKNMEILHEVSHIKTFLEESVKSINFSRNEESAAVANLLDGFDSLEKAFIAFAEI